MVTSGWWITWMLALVLVEWRYAQEDSGALSVMTSGITMRLKLFAGNWDIQPLVWKYYYHAAVNNNYLLLYFATYFILNRCCSMHWCLLWTRKWPYLFGWSSLYWQWSHLAIMQARWHWHSRLWTSWRCRSLLPNDRLKTYYYCEVYMTKGGQLQ